MSIDGLLTFFGFLAAAFALLDEVTKLRILLHAKRQILLFFIAFTSIGLLLLPKNPSSNIPAFYPETISSMVVSSENSAIGTKGAAFIILILWSLTSMYLYYKARPTISSLKKLNLLVERLRNQGRYLEMIDVVKPYLPLIQKASRRDLFLQIVHDWLSAGGQSPNTLSIDLYFQEMPKSKMAKEFLKAKNLLGRCRRKLISPLSIFVPPLTEATRIATDIEISLLNSTGLKGLLVHSRADFIIDLMDLDRSSVNDFASDLISRMMSNSESHFFRELRLMDTTRGDGSYFYENQLVLMRRFALDSKFVYNHSIWKPIGDCSLRIIEEDNEYRDALLKEPPDDADLLTDPIYCTIRYFLAMVASAAWNEEKFHMWLGYLSIISESLIETHSNWSGDNSESEFPTLATRLIYEITCVQRDIIKLYKKLPDTNYHVARLSIDTLRPQSIVIWAIMDYAKVIRDIACSDILPSRFKVDLWGSYVHFISQIVDNERFSCLRKTLISQAIETDSFSAHENVKECIRELHAKIDPHLRYFASDVSEALEA